MWFVSQVQPALLAALRARVLRWVVVVESLLLTFFMGIGIRFAGPHDGTSAQLVVIALLLLLSLHRHRARDDAGVAAGLTQSPAAR